ncbi:MAG: hypothetical protein AB7G47_19835 [Mycolicibacterium sp.]|uniref:hypothetical protein n=1 Tax=Mycolicibacterium sp. TaxID=2320850 RepID=UPI003D10D858
MTGLNAIITLAIVVPTLVFIAKFTLRRAGRTVVKNYPVVVMPTYPPSPAYPPPVVAYPGYPPTVYPAQPPFTPPTQAVPEIPDVPVSDEEKFEAIVQDFYTR